MKSALNGHLLQYYIKRTFGTIQSVYVNYGFYNKRVIQQQKWYAYSSQIPD